MIGVVNEDCVLRGEGVEPLSVVLDLKPGHSVVYEEREKPVIGMRGNTDGLIRLRTGRVVVGRVQLEARVEIQSFVHEPLFEP